jgi:uncharacterized protein YggE
MTRLRSILLLAGVLLAASAVAGVAQPRFGNAAATPSATRTITVTGNGSITTVPDRASFSFTVDSRAATAKAALAQNAEAAAAVIAALKNAGVASRDLQTGQVSLSPQLSDDGTTVVGYAASNSVTAATALAKAGALVDAAVGAGATGVSGPSFTRSDADSLYGDALKAAVANAGDKAKTLAAASGLTLGAVQTVVEGSQAPPVVYSAGKAADAVATPIEPGSQSIDATVTVTYAVS